MAFPTPNDSHSAPQKQGKASELANSSQSRHDIENTPGVADNRRTRPSSNHPSTVAPMSSRQLIVDLDHFSSLILQKLAVLQAAREFGEAVAYFEIRFLEVHFGPHKIHIPIRPGIETLPIPPAAGAVQLPAPPPAAEPPPGFQPSVAQCRIFEALRGGQRKSYAELREQAGRWFIDRVVTAEDGHETRRSGHKELMRLGLLDRDDQGAFFLTAAGEHAAIEFGPSGDAQDDEDIDEHDEVDD